MGRFVLTGIVFALRGAAEVGILRRLGPQYEFRNEAIRLHLIRHPAG